MEKLKHMTGEDFIREVLAGKIDFQRIELIGNADKHCNLGGCEGFKVMNNHLKMIGSVKKIDRYLSGEDSNIPFHPLRIEKSDFSDVTAKGFHLPFVYGPNACFYGANLEGAYFRRASFNHADFRDANLEGAIFDEAVLKEANFLCANLKGASFRYADLRYADFNRANLQKADFKKADLLRADFTRADIRDIKNLEEASYIGTIKFWETTTRHKEERFLIEILREKYFVG